MHLNHREQNIHGKHSVLIQCINVTNVVHNLEKLSSNYFNNQFG